MPDDPRRAVRGGGDGLDDLLGGADLVGELDDLVLHSGWTMTLTPGISRAGRLDGLEA